LVSKAARVSATLATSSISSNSTALRASPVRADMAASSRRCASRRFGSPVSASMVPSLRSCRCWRRMRRYRAPPPSSRISAAASAALRSRRSRLASWTALMRAGSSAFSAVACSLASRLRSSPFIRAWSICLAWRR